MTDWGEVINRIDKQTTMLIIMTAKYKQYWFKQLPIKKRQIEG